MENLKVGDIVIHRTSGTFGMITEVLENKFVVIFPSGMSETTLSKASWFFKDISSSIRQQHGK